MKLPSEAINSLFKRLHEQYELPEVGTSFLNEDGTYKTIKQVLKEVAETMKEEDE